MDRKEILQFEEDDTSEVGANGKQVFVTKRINGKTTHNKAINENNQNILNREEKENLENQEDLFIEFKNLKYDQENATKNTKIATNKNIKRKSNKKRISKKRKKKRRILKIAALIAIITGIIIFTLVSPIFNITNIEISGNETINESTIESLSGKQKGKNIFQINKKEIINSIKENAYIDSVLVKRKLPGTLQIAVSERKIAYQVKVINSYVYLDYKGYILENSSKTANVPTISGFSTDQDTLLNKKKISNEDIKRYMNTLFKIMESAKNAEIWDKINTITIRNNEYILDLNKEDKKVYLGKATDLTNSMMYVKVILEKEKGNKGEIFVNGELNDGFKPYFREQKQEDKKEEKKQ